MEKLPLIVISGPTASGKTALGVKIAKAFNGEVVSADSMQIYKGLEIASASPTAAETDGIKHHMVGILNLNEPFSVAEYCKKAKAVIEDICSRNKLPVIVGGTGLYINSLIDNIDFLDYDSAKIREALIEEYNKNGIESLYVKLEQLDYAAAQKIEKNNARRIIRALEICLASGKTFTEQNLLAKPKESPYNYIWFNIEFFNREVLYNRIHSRIENMVSMGLIEEAKSVRALCAENGAGQAIGHKEIYPYLDGQITLSEALENLKTATRHYAKRQITWFKKRQDVIPLVFDKEDILNKAICAVIDWRNT